MGVSEVCPKKAYGITVGEEESVWLARIVMDDDRDEALDFVKSVVYRQIESYERRQLRSHLDTQSSPTVAPESHRRED